MSLFNPNDGAMLSRLTFGNMPVASGEIFGKATYDGFFASGFAALGTVPSGSFQDEDFPPFTDPYSSTTSDQRGGAVGYATVDIGHNFIDWGGIQAGAFIGYNYLRQDFKEFGCVGCPIPVSDSTETIGQNLTWQSLRVGVSGRADFDNKLSVTGDAAVLPYVALSGRDAHLLRIPSDFSGPTPEDGTGWGVQLQAMLDYQVNDQFSVGVGGRYWHMQTRGSEHFEAVTADGGPEPQDWQTNVFGLLTEVKAHF